MPDYAYACLMMKVDPSLSKRIRSWLRAHLDVADLKKMPEDFHVTIKYGIVGDALSQVKKVIQKARINPVKIKLGAVSSFSHPDQDVLKITVVSGDCRKLNNALVEQLQTVETHDGYRAHITLAYLKKGKAWKYGKITNPFRDEKATLTTFTYTAPGKPKQTFTMRELGVIGMDFEKAAFLMGYKKEMEQDAEFDKLAFASGFKKEMEKLAYQGGGGSSFMSPNPMWLPIILDILQAEEGKALPAAAHGAGRTVGMTMGIPVGALLGGAAGAGVGHLAGGSEENPWPYIIGGGVGALGGGIGGGILGNMGAKYLMRRAVGDAKIDSIFNKAETESNKVPGTKA